MSVTGDVPTGLREADMRMAVRTALTQHQREVSPLLVDELVLAGQDRIDLALVTDQMHGFELKSDYDSLARLPRQMQSYSQVFDFCTLVVPPRHLAGARARLGRGWGLVLIQPESDGGTRYRVIRKARPNGQVRAERLVQLLWRAEALAALEAIGAAAGYRSKPRTELWGRLCEVTTLDELKATVRTALRARRGWRDGRPQRARGARFRPEDTSSRFLARRIR